MRLIHFVFTATLVLFLFSRCKKENLPNEPTRLLQRIIYRSGDSVLYTFFYYDQQSKLIAISDSNNNGHLWKTLIGYNTLENPVNYKVLYRNNPNGAFTESSDSLIYNDNGQVIKKISLSPAYPNKMRNGYRYDASGRLAADSMYSYWADEVSGYTVFSYDNNNNIVQLQDFYESTSGEINSGRDITASYSTENSPYNCLGLAAYFIRGDIFLLSKHNTTLIKYYDGSERSFQYKYYTNGLPERADVTHNYNNTTGFFATSTITFFYD